MWQNLMFKAGTVLLAKDDLNPGGSWGSDPWQEMAVNDIKNDYFPNLAMGALIQLVQKTGLGICVIVSVWAVILIMIGNSKTRDEGKSLLINKLFMIGLISGAIGILTLIYQITSQLAGYPAGG